MTDNEEKIAQAEELSVTDKAEKEIDEIDETEELTVEFFQAIIDEFDAIHARLDNTDSKFSALISAVSSLTEVLKSRPEISSATDDDINDMSLVIKGQREIINAIITIPELDESIKRTIAKHLMSLNSWEVMEAAQTRLHNREAQKTNAFNIEEPTIRRTPMKSSVANVQNKMVQPKLQTQQGQQAKQTQQQTQPPPPQVQIKARPDAMPATRPTKATTSWGASQNKRQPVQQKTPAQPVQPTGRSSGGVVPPPIRITSLNSK